MGLDEQTEQERVEDLAWELYDSYHLDEQGRDDAIAGKPLHVAQQETAERGGGGRGIGDFRPPPVVAEPEPTGYFSRLAHRAGRLFD